MRLFSSIILSFYIFLFRALSVLGPELELFNLRGVRHIFNNLSTNKSFSYSILSCNFFNLGDGDLRC